MAKLKDTTIDSYLTVTENTNLNGTVTIDGVLFSPSWAGSADISVGGTLVLSSESLNLVNSATVNVSVTAGSTGNANVELSTNSSAVVSFGTLNVTPSTSQVNYNPAGLSTAKALRINSASTIKVTGIEAQSDGFELRIVNASPDNLLIIEHEGATSNAANRLDFPDGMPAFMFPEDSISFIYNTTRQRWVCSAYPNKGPAMGLTFFEDFISGTGSSMTQFVSGTAASIQAGTYLVNTTEKPQGVIQLDTGSTSTGRAQIGSGGGAQIVPGQGAALSIARVASESGSPTLAENYRIRTGFEDSHGAATVTDGLYWELFPAGWQCAVSNAASFITITQSPSPTTDANYIWLGVYMTPSWNTAVYFFSQDSSNVVISSIKNIFVNDMPSPTNLVGWMGAQINKTAGTAQRNLSVDFVGYRYDGARA